MTRLTSILVLSATLVSPLASALAQGVSRAPHRGGVDLAQLDIGPAPGRDAGAAARAGATAAGACDTGAWTGYVDGTSSPQQSCYTTKASPRIEIPFAASVGIGPENMADPLPPPGIGPTSSSPSSSSRRGRRRATCVRNPGSSSISRA